MPPVTLILIALNVAVFLFDGFPGDTLIRYFALWPLGSVDSPSSAPFQPWQVVTYAFLHGNWAHLFFNMLALYMFGFEIERLFGSARFALYYFACVLGASVTQLIVLQLLGGPAVPTVGASGGVFGILLAFGMTFPQRRIMLLFPPIPMPAWLFVTLYGALELVLGVTGTAQGVAHFAHLGGMAAGFVLIQIWRQRR
jgi:membrane associated rhomboid family serine protease